MAKLNKPNKKTRKAIEDARRGRTEPFSFDTVISNALIRELIDQEKAQYERMTNVEAALNRMQQSIDRLQQTIANKRRG